MDETNRIVTRGAALAFMLVFGIVCVGSIIIPYFVANSTGRWEYLLIYPALLVLIIIAAGIAGRKKKND